MEAIVVFVGFLGAGKTTLLKKVVERYVEKNWKPFIILNDYENAHIDSQNFLSYLNSDSVKALNGSCICCSGVNELRNYVNSIEVRDKGITFIEANGTTDSVNLMGFLGVGMKQHFLPPVQIAVVDVRNWQKRGLHNELEANQVQVSSVIVLNYVDHVAIKRLEKVEQGLRNINPQALIVHSDKLDIDSFPRLHPSLNEADKMDHDKAHWSSCSIDLPDPISSERLNRIIRKIPSAILRVKGCTRFDDDEHYSHFERVPSGEFQIRPYHWVPITGPKLVTIGPGSDPYMLKELVTNS
jgi:G3E family GTPase